MIQCHDTDCRVQLEKYYMGLAGKLRGYFVHKCGNAGTPDLVHRLFSGRLN